MGTKSNSLPEQSDTFGIYQQLPLSLVKFKILLTIYSFPGTGLQIQRQTSLGPFPGRV